MMFSMETNWIWLPLMNDCHNFPASFKMSICTNRCPVIYMYKYMSVKLWTTSHLVFLAGIKPHLAQVIEKKITNFKIFNYCQLRKYCHLHLLHYVTRNIQPGNYTFDICCHGSCSSLTRIYKAHDTITFYMEFLGLQALLRIIFTPGIMYDCSIQGIYLIEENQQLVSSFFQNKPV